MGNVFQYGQSGGGVEYSSLQVANTSTSVAFSNGNRTMTITIPEDVDPWSVVSFTVLSYNAAEMPLYALTGLDDGILTRYYKILLSNTNNTLYDTSIFSAHWNYPAPGTVDYSAWGWFTKDGQAIGSGQPSITMYLDDERTIRLEIQNLFFSYSHSNVSATPTFSTSLMISVYYFT